MATTYTFEVRPVESRQENRSDRSSNENIDERELKSNALPENSIVLNTKGCKFIPVNVSGVFFYTIFSFSKSDVMFTNGK